MEKSVRIVDPSDLEGDDGDFVQLKKLRKQVQEVLKISLHINYMVYTCRNKDCRNNGPRQEIELVRAQELRHASTSQPIDNDVGYTATTLPVSIAQETFSAILNAPVTTCTLTSIAPRQNTIRTAVRIPVTASSCESASTSYTPSVTSAPRQKTIQVSVHAPETATPIGTVTTAASSSTIVSQRNSTAVSIDRMIRDIIEGRINDGPTGSTGSCLRPPADMPGTDDDSDPDEPPILPPQQRRNVAAVIDDIRHAPGNHDSPQAQHRQAPRQETPQHRQAPRQEAPQHRHAQQRRQGDRRDAIAADLSDEDADEQPRQRRRLSELIRENHELYNTFMTRTVPRILQHYGISLDD